MIVIKHATNNYNIQNSFEKQRFESVIKNTEPGLKHNEEIGF